MATYNLKAIERRTILRALNDHPSIVKAAKALGITRYALKRKMIKHSIIDRGDEASP